MKIIKEDKEPLFFRKKILMGIEHEKSSTPNIDNVKKQAVELLKINPELLRLRNIYTKFGENKSDVICYAYDNAESLQKFEIIKKKVKKEKAKEPEKEKPK